MKRRRSKPSDGAAFVAGFKEAAVWAEPKPRQPQMELPLPDYAPFAVPSDEVWRELQRRRNLVRMVETLAQSARDEGFPLSSQILSDTVGKLRAALIVVEAGRQPPKPRRSPRSETHQAAETSKTNQRAPSRRRKKQAPAQDQPALGLEPDEVVASARTTSTADALAALEQAARVLRTSLKG
jgi:hypothetical protein